MSQTNIEAIYPLTPTQTGLLFHTIERPSSGVYFQQLVCKLQGDLDVLAFEQAWEAAVQRHAALRALFTWERRNQPLQLIRRQVELPWRHEDWSNLGVAEQDAQLERLLTAEREQGFDLSQAPLMRFDLIQFGPDSYRFIWNWHHLLSDGWSTPLVLKDVFAFYQADCQGQSLSLPSPRTFQDFVRWQQERNVADAEPFWRTELQNLSAATSLSIAGNRKTAQVRTGYAQKRWDVPDESAAGLRALAQSDRVTLNTVFQGAWALLLSRYNRNDDVLFGVTVSGRPATLPGVEETVGMFINTLPLRVEVSAEQRLQPWLQVLQARNMRLREYEHVPLNNIQRWSEVAPGEALFETILVFENYPMDNALLPEQCNIQLLDVEHIEQSNYPLAIIIVPGAPMHFYLIYDEQRFSEASINRLASNYLSILADITDRANPQLGDIQIVAEDERRHILFDLNETQTDTQPDTAVHQLIEAQAALAPDAPAVHFRDQVLTYAQLNQQANQLARHLNSLGVKADTPVALLLERSPDMVVGILATLKAGGAYIPLDPQYPADRLSFMLSDSQAPVVLTQSHMIDDLSVHDATVVCLDREWDAIARNADHNLELDVAPANLAYIIYTSGSTGQPNGVMITHRNLAHSTTARGYVYSQPPSSFLLLSSFSFDSSVVGLFWTLSQGGALCLLEPNGEQDVEEIARIIETHQVTHTLCLPTLYRILLDYVHPQRLQSLQVAIVAGEACPAGLATHHYDRLPHAMLYNEYGPTEGTVWSTVYQIPRSASGSAVGTVPIGHPIPNMQAYILDAQLNVVPEGVAGELFIGGHGVAQGYLNRPDLTMERFIPQPDFGLDQVDKDGSVSQSPVLYRTGDLARYSADDDGNPVIEFLGRVDNQVKIRGYRIEVEEVEAVLRRHPALQEAVVVARTQQRGSDFSSVVSSEISDLETQLLALDGPEAEQVMAEIERLTDSQAEALLTKPF